VTPAGHRARTSYKCKIKILKLQIDSTGYSGIREKAKEDLAEKKGDFVLMDVREKDEIAEDGGANTDHGGGGSNFDTCINVETKTNCEA
jgi:hypothetical protein